MCHGFHFTESYSGMTLPDAFGLCAMAFKNLKVLVIKPMTAGISELFEFCFEAPSFLEPFRNRLHSVGSPATGLEARAKRADLNALRPVFGGTRFQVRSRRTIAVAALAARALRRSIVHRAEIAAWGARR